MKNLAIIILAAGKGKRMKSATPKVLHPLCGRPMLGYVLDLVKSLRAQKAVCVLGFGQEAVRKLVPAGMRIAVQKNLLGSADAVKTGLSRLKGFKGTVLVLYGDTPLLKKGTAEKLIKYHNQSGAGATLLVGSLKKPEGYGRILRDKCGMVSGIAEEKDADDFQKSIKEVNTGIVCFDAQALSEGIRKIRPNNLKKEYYLTDAISILYKAGRLVEAIKLEDINEALGINSRLDLARANSLMQERLNAKLMLDGVSIVDPRSTFIGFGAKIGPDSVIWPFTVIAGGVRIGKGCSVGPFTHLREGTVVGDKVIIGNFLEAVRSRIGRGCIAKHFSYLGDSLVEPQANIGAGTVTANFDGRLKQRTVIGRSAFIGSDTVLIAPVKVGRSALTGAGSVLTRDVPPGCTVAGVPAKIIRRKNG